MRNDEWKAQPPAFHSSFRIYHFALDFRDDREVNFPVPPPSRPRRTPVLRLLGSPRRCCDGLTRRETLRAGAITALGGLSLPQLLAAESAGQARPGKAKSVIVLYLLGGAATQDMWDLKPNAPAEVR